MDLIRIDDDLAVEREIARDLARAYETIAGCRLTPSILALALREFLTASGLRIDHAIEMETPAVNAAEFTGSDGDGETVTGDFVVRVEVLKPGTLVNPPRGAEAHICSVPFSFRSHRQGYCPRCGREQ